MTKKPTSIRMSEEGTRLRKLLAEKLGVSETSVLELAIRDLAEKKGITSESQNADQRKSE